MYVIYRPTAAAGQQWSRDDQRWTGRREREGGMGREEKGKERKRQIERDIQEIKRR